MLIPAVSAGEGDVEDVEMRLDSAIQYPNDRPITIVVEGMGFLDDKPSRSRVQVDAELRWANGTIAERQSANVQPGIRTPITFGTQSTVGSYFIHATARVGTVSSDPESQRTRVTYAPQEYTAGFLSEGRFLVSPLDENTNLTVTEYLDTGTGIIEGRTWVIGNESLDVEVPQGYLAIRYNVIDENGWMNYERANSGLTVHGSPYVWLYGDLTRIEPVASFVRWGSIAFGVVGGLLVLTGASRYASVFRDERLKRRKELGIENSPSWSERQRDKRHRRDLERRYEPQRYNDYRRRF